MIGEPLAFPPETFLMLKHIIFRLLAPFPLWLGTRLINGEVLITTRILASVDAWERGDRKGLRLGAY